MHIKWTILVSILILLPVLLVSCEAIRECEAKGGKRLRNVPGITIECYEVKSLRKL